MAMVSLQADDGDDYGASPGRDSKFGWGTSISLTDGQVKALGIKDDASPGTVYLVKGLAVVYSTSEDLDADQDGDGLEKQVRLQFTELELKSGEQLDLKKAAAQLYG